jgi:hypothetical protein
MLPRSDFMMVWIPAVLVFAARVEDDEVATVGAWGLGLGAWGLGLGAWGFAYAYVAAPNLAQHVALFRAGLLSTDCLDHFQDRVHNQVRLIGHHFV